MARRPDQFVHESDTDSNDYRQYIGERIAEFVPQWLARRGIEASVSTDRECYHVDEPVIISIVFRNRLPLPLSVQTETQKLFGWAVDGLFGASDEDTYLSKTPNRIDFEPFEEKKLTRRWSGRFKRTDDRTRWEPATPGVYEIEGFLGTNDSGIRATTTVEITN
jgi:hypothetical protein